MTRRPATMADLEALPEGVKGEIIEGVLYTAPRPRAPHMRVEGRIHGGLDGPFDMGRNGPGGWWLVIEPGIQLPEATEFSPDVAGWRRERMPEYPSGPFVVVPDWLCEVLSPTTRAYDLRVKRSFYARIGVAYLWYVDIDSRTLTVSKLVEGRWSELGVFGDNEIIRAEPFDAVELALADWWPPAPPPA